MDHDLSIIKNSRSLRASSWDRDGRNQDSWTLEPGETRTLADITGPGWPPDLHGTGSEDYFNQAWGMQDNAFLRNGSSIYEKNTGGYQTSYVFHLENPVRFRKSIRATIEHGHGNHLCNEVSSVAYWYAQKPARARKVPSVEKRKHVLRDNQGGWLYNRKNQTTSGTISPNREMLAMKKRWQAKQ